MCFWVLHVFCCLLFQWWSSECRCLTAPIQLAEHVRRPFLSKRASLHFTEVIPHNWLWISPSKVFTSWRTSLCKTYWTMKELTTLWLMWFLALQQVRWLPRQPCHWTYAKHSSTLRRDAHGLMHPISMAWFLLLGRCMNFKACAAFSRVLLLGWYFRCQRRPFRGQCTRVSSTPLPKSILWKMPCQNDYPLELHQLPLTQNKWSYF